MDDEDEWLDSEEGQRWAAECERASRRAAESLRRMSAALEGMRVQVVDMQFEREVYPGGASDTIVRKAMQRIARSEQGGNREE